MRILPLDISNCYECPCSVIETGWLGDVVEVVCQCTSKYVTAYDSEVPDWCPAKEEKQNERDNHI